MGLLIIRIWGRNSAPFPMPKSIFFPIPDEKFLTRPSLLGPQKTTDVSVENCIKTVRKHKIVLIINFSILQQCPTSFLNDLLFARVVVLSITIFQNEQVASLTGIIWERIKINASVFCPFLWVILLRQNY